MTQQRTSKQNVLITGASSGIGEATAHMFAKEGFRVFGTSRSERPDKDGIEMLVLDVQSDDSVEECIANIRTRVGQVDVLVNNAGTMHEGFAEETAMEDARALFETNFFGVVRMTNAVLPDMRSRRQGRIINVGSLAACVGEPGEAFYSASKCALARYTESLRHEVWPLGLHISLVEPGEFKTNVLQASSKSEGTIADYETSRQAVRDTMHDALEQGDDPDKVAELILKIARSQSPRLRYGAGKEAHWLPYLKALLPQRLFDYLLRKGFGLQKEKAE